MEDSKIRILEEVVDLKIEIYDNMIRDIRHDRTMKQADRDEAVKTMTGMISRLKHDLTDHQREERDEWTERHAPQRERRRNAETPRRSTEERLRDIQDQQRDSQNHPRSSQGRREDIVIHLDDSDEEGHRDNQRSRVPLTPLSPPRTPLRPDLGRSSLKRKHAPVKTEEEDDDDDNDDLFLSFGSITGRTSPKRKRTYQDDAIEELRRDALASKRTKPKPAPKGFRVPRALPRVEFSPTRKIFGRSESMDGVERQRPAYESPSGER